MDTHWWKSISSQSCQFWPDRPWLHLSSWSIILQKHKNQNRLNNKWWWYEIETWHFFFVFCQKRWRQVAPPFASGIVFLSAMLDRLTVQCFYNRDLLNILQAKPPQYIRPLIFKIDCWSAAIMLYCLEWFRAANNQFHWLTFLKKIVRSDSVRIPFLKRSMRWIIYRHSYLQATTATKIFQVTLSSHQS